MTPGMMNEIREVVAEESDSSEFGVAAAHRRELFVEVERLRAALRMAHALLDLERPHGERACLRKHEPADQYGDCSDCRWALVIDTAERALEGTP